jgi:DNA-binding transcriptional LysR family regulator
MQDLWQSSSAVSLSNQVEDLFGRVKIGCHNSVAMEVFPKFLPLLLEKYPRLDVDTTFATSLEVTQKVARLELDLGFVINPVKNPDLIARKISVAFVGIWRRKGGGVCKALLFHPDMYQVPKIVAGSPDMRKVPIADYEVIARSVANSDCLGILPDEVARRHGLVMEGEKLFETHLNLILHTQRFSPDVRSRLIQEATRAFQSSG